MFNKIEHLNRSQPTRISINQSPLFLDNEIAQTLTILEEHEWVSIDCKLRPEIYDAGFKPLFNLCLNQEEQLFLNTSIAKGSEETSTCTWFRQKQTRWNSLLHKPPTSPSVRYLVHTKREWTYVARKTNKAGATEFA